MTIYVRRPSNLRPSCNGKANGPAAKAFVVVKVAVPVKVASSGGGDGGYGGVFAIQSRYCCTPVGAIGSLLALGITLASIGGQNCGAPYTAAGGLIAQAIE